MPRIAAVSSGLSPPVGRDNRESLAEGRDTSPRSSSSTGAPWASPPFPHLPLSARAEVLEDSASTLAILGSFAARDVWTGNTNTAVPGGHDVAMTWCTAVPGMMAPRLGEALQVYSSTGHVEA